MQEECDQRWSELWRSDTTLLAYPNWRLLSVILFLFTIFCVNLKLLYHLIPLRIIWEVANPCMASCDFLSKCNVLTEILCWNSETTKNVLVAAVYIPLMCSKMVKYATELPTVCPKILLIGPAGNEAFKVCRPNIFDRSLTCVVTSLENHINVLRQ